MRKSFIFFTLTFLLLISRVYAQPWEPGAAPVQGVGDTGTPKGKIVTVQGISGGTAIPVSSPSGSSASQIQGTAADGAVAVGNPVQVGGKDVSGNIQSILTGTDGAVKIDGSGVTQPVSGPLTDTQLRATAVSVSGTVTVNAVIGTLTNRSGTITTGGTAQTLMAANSSRKYLLIQNVSTGDLWFNFTTTAVQDQPSMKLTSGASFVMEGNFISTEAVSIIGPTTGQAFASKEG